MTGVLAPAGPSHAACHPLLEANVSAFSLPPPGPPDASAPPAPVALARVVSGGQAGVDRGALDAARAAGLAASGWCPRGRAAEDGPIPARYPLRETRTDDPAERTLLNVRDSDGTLVLVAGPPAGGTRLTIDAADALGRPVLVLDPTAAGSVERAAAWIGGAAIRTLNVAGPRASEWGGGYAASRAFVAALAARLSASPPADRT